MAASTFSSPGPAVTLVFTTGSTGNTGELRILGSFPVSPVIPVVKFISSHRSSQVHSLLANSRAPGSIRDGSMVRSVLHEAGCHDYRTVAGARAGSARDAAARRLRTGAADAGARQGRLQGLLAPKRRHRIHPRCQPRRARLHCGKIASDGTYTLSTGDAAGAAPGWYRVTVSSLADTSFSQPGAQGFTYPQSLLPEKYRDPEQSLLTCEVKPSRTNNIDFNLD